jgi:hypothetical protein
VPYCITLRSRTDARITGWYAGRSCLWSTDYKRQKRFDDPHDASTVCHELRSLYPRNAKVINIEVAQEELHLPLPSLLSANLTVPSSPLRYYGLIYIDLRRNALNALFNHLIRAGAAVAGYADLEAADFPAKLAPGYMGAD